MSEVYNVIPPSGKRLPIVISVPHCGTDIPSEIRNDFRPEALEWIDDTDWFVDKLYDFAPALGITMITAKVSRWAIDLNRDPTGAPLYKDGRIITALCPATDFLGNELYKDKRVEVKKLEVDRRVSRYFLPYYDKLEILLSGLRQEFGSVLLWDCHSIRQVVPTIQKEKFPDLILGSADEKSASPDLIKTALSKLGEGKYTVSHNDPFKGGYITRKFGNPNKNIHALQLEMPKINYMDDAEVQYDERRAESVRTLLKSALASLAETISG
jgi:N-formylglutamate deformylase